MKDMQSSMQEMQEWRKTANSAAGSSSKALASPVPADVDAKLDEKSNGNKKRVAAPKVEPQTPVKSLRKLPTAMRQELKTATQRQSPVKSARKSTKAKRQELKTVVPPKKTVQQKKKVAEVAAVAVLATLRRSTRTATTTTNAR